MTLAKRTHRIWLAALLVPASITVAMPSAASAAGCSSAPGVSAVSQYCESVPNADGSSNRTKSGTSKPAISSSTAKSLARDGADGAAVAALTTGGGSGGSGTSGGSGGGSSSSASKPKKHVSGKTSAANGGASSTGQVAVKSEKVNSPADPSGSPLKAATKAVADGPTAGGGVVWGIVGLSVAGVAGAFFVRRRSGGFDPPNTDG